MVHDDIPFDHEVLQTLPLGYEELGQGDGANARGIEPLEGLGILTPRPDKDVKSRPALDVGRL